MPVYKTLHKEVLTKKQSALLPLVTQFSKDFYLVGGTAIALYIGHRFSIDFDLFSNKEFDNFKIREKVIKYGRIGKVLLDEFGQYTIVINGVRITFLYYPFKINFPKKFGDIIKMPDLLTLAATKAYALGRRAKWKDYVDLYFIGKNYHGIGDIVKKARKIFGHEFNEKLFRVQLSYFKDIDYSEKVIYLPGFKVPDKVVQKGLVNFSLS